MNKTYMLLYSPATDTNFTIEESSINFLCSDGKIHIRLKDFNNDEVISGFINKLTFLVTYLTNYVIIKNETIITSKEDLLQQINTSINDLLFPIISNSLHNDNFKGIKITKNYKRTKSFNIYGSIDKTCCPYSSKCSLSFFLNTLNINLHDYLFNDSYEIIIKELKQKEVYNKFINKSNKNNNITIDKRIELW